MNDKLKLARLEIQRIAEDQGGEVTAAQVVEEARKPTSPLHSLFDWDDKTAADKHRLTQARALIRSVRVEIKTETTKVRSVGFVRNPDIDPREQGYVSVQSVRSDEDRQRDILLAEFTRAAAAINRAREIATVFGMTESVDQFLHDLDVMAKAVSSASATQGGIQ